MVGENQAGHMVLWGWGWWGQWRELASNFSLSLDLIPACTHMDLLSDLADSIPVLLCSTDSHGQLRGNTTPYMYQDVWSEVHQCSGLHTCARIFVCHCLLLNSLCPGG